MRYCFKNGFIICPEVFGAGYKVSYSRGEFKKHYKEGKVFNLQESFQAVWDLYTKIYNYDKNK